MHARHRLVTFATVAACLAFSWGQNTSMAAPVNPGPKAEDAQSPEDQAADRSTDWAAGAVPGASKTMELLLEMQKRETPTPANASATSSARPAADRPAGTVARPVTAGSLGLGISQPASRAGADALSQVPGTSAVLGAGLEPPAPMLFGATRAPAIEATRSPAAEWQAAPGGGNSAPPRQNHSSSELQRWASMPAEFIAWLRQNRYAVVGAALATLLVVWVGGALVSRRRHAH